MTSPSMKCSDTFCLSLLTELVDFGPLWSILVDFGWWWLVLVDCGDCGCWSMVFHGIPPSPDPHLTLPLCCSFHQTVATEHAAVHENSEVPRDVRPGVARPNGPKLQTVCWSLCKKEWIGIQIQQRSQRDQRFGATIRWKWFNLAAPVNALLIHRLIAMLLCKRIRLSAHKMLEAK